MTEQKKPEDRVMRRLYSLYKEQVSRLEEMSKARKMPQSQFLRELIDCAFVSYRQTAADRVPGAAVKEFSEAG